MRKTNRPKKHYRYYGGEEKNVKKPLTKKKVIKKVGRKRRRKSDDAGGKMKNEDKTKKQLVKELKKLRGRIAKLEKLETERKGAEERFQRLKDELEIKVAERTNELEEKLKELEIFYDAAVDREHLEELVELHQLNTETVRLPTGRKEKK